MRSAVASKIAFAMADAGRPLSEPIRGKNVIGTVLHTLFDVGALRLVPGAPREIAQTMTGYEPIPGLLA